MDEREFYNEKAQIKNARLLCPHCRTEGEYGLHWIVRTKKQALSPRASAEDRARFQKAQSYMVRRDDKVSCANPRCRKTFEINGVQSIAFLP
jgi:hypothetical protein